LQKGVAAHEGFSPAIADCGRQGTATSPPSTASSSIVQNTAAFGPARKPVLKGSIACAAGIFQIFGRLRELPDLWRRGWDSNPRYPFEVHTLSRRADSTSSRTSPYASIHPEYRHLGRRGPEVGDGGRGIRTPEEPFGPLIDFESIAFVHSAIPPYRRRPWARPRAEEPQAARAPWQPSPLSRQRGHCAKLPGQ
jgi:hypothetical protein